MKAKSQKQIPPGPPFKKGGTFVKGQISPRHIKAIHAVVHKLGLDDDAYREILMQRYRAKSCKELTWQQAEELLEHLNGTPSPTLPRWGRESNSSPQRGEVRRGALKYTDMDRRPGFASGAQLRLIDAMWNQVSRAEEPEAREKALDSFVNRIAQVAGLRMLKGWQVEKIVRALEGMGAEIKNRAE